MRTPILLAAVLLSPAYSWGQTTASSNTVVKSQPINAVLMMDLNARRAKVGDAVKARAYSGFVAADGTRVAPGSMLNGHVTEAAGLGRGSIESRLGVLFDQAQLSSGQTVVLHLGIAGFASAPPPADGPTVSPEFTADASSVPGAQSGARVDPRGIGGAPGARAARGIAGGTSRPTDPLRDTNTSLRDATGVGGLTDAPARIAQRGGKTVATVGSTVPGIALKGSALSGTVLVSTSDNIALASGTPLVLTAAASESQR